MKYLSLIALLALTGCAYHPAPVIVYGHSGALFIAPDLCAALTKCLNSTETSCFYNKDTVVNLGVIQESGCKEVKK